MRLKTTSDLYEATLAKANTYPTVPTDIIGYITSAVAQAAAQNTEYVLLPRLSLLYILEYSNIFKVGDPTGPYACMEWPDIQIPQALLTLLLEDIPIPCPFSNEEGNSHDNNICFYD